MLDQAVIAAGTIVSMGFLFRKAWIATAAGVCGWVYPEVTVLTLGVSVLLGIWRSRQESFIKQDFVEQDDDDDCIDAEFTVVKDG